MTNRLLITRTLSLCTSVAFGMFVFSGCEQECSDDAWNLSLADSPELEAYVIARYDFRQSLSEFERYLNRIDLSELEWIEENGRMVMRLPGTPPEIGTKIEAWNETNRALLRKFPEITSLSAQAKGNYMEYCVQHSVAVSARLLDMGIDACLPRTKRMVNEWGEVFDFIDTHMGRPDYVEAMIIGYADGGSCIYIDPRNTANGSYSPDWTMINGVAHYPEGGNNSAVVMVAHTHRYSPDASDADKAAVYPPGVVGAIYYDGAFYKFTK